MAAQVPDISNFKHQIVAWLPLNVKRLVHGVRQFVGAVVIGKREKRGAAFDCAGIRESQVSGIAAGPRSKRSAPGSFERAAVGVSESAAGLLIHPRRSLVHAERSAGDHAGGKSGGKVSEEFTAIV